MNQEIMCLGNQEKLKCVGTIEMDFVTREKPVNFLTKSTRKWYLGPQDVHGEKIANLKCKIDAVSSTLELVCRLKTINRQSG